MVQPIQSRAKASHMIQKFHFWLYSQKDYYKQDLREILFMALIHVHSSISHNSQEVKAAQVNVHGQRDKQNVVYTYNRILVDL